MITAKPKPDEFLRSLGQEPTAGVELYRRAYKDGLGLSAYLEREMPEDEFKDGMDAFTRLLQRAGIFTRSVP